LIMVVVLDFGRPYNVRCSCLGVAWRLKKLLRTPNSFERPTRHWKRASNGKWDNMEFTNVVLYEFLHFWDSTYDMHHKPKMDDGRCCVKDFVCKCLEGMM
jgi:hypothetical protein